MDIVAIVAGSVGDMFCARERGVLRVTNKAARKALPIKVVNFKTPTIDDD